MVKFQLYPSNREYVNLNERKNCISKKGKTFNPKIVGDKKKMLGKKI